MFLRTGNINDSDDVLAWRNDLLTREMSLNSQVVEKLDHELWFERKLRDPNCYFMIGEENGRKIGVVRFDIEPISKEAEVSINLNPAFRGMKLSHSLLQKAIDLFLKDCDFIVCATVKNTNIPSIRIFEACGFIFLSEEDDIRRYHLRRQKS